MCQINQSTNQSFGNTIIVKACLMILKFQQLKIYLYVDGEIMSKTCPSISIVSVTDLLAKFDFL